MSGLRRFVIRLGKVVAVLVALLVVAHTVATIVTGRQLARELQGLKAAGEPLTLAELLPKPVPNEENAAPLYQQAFATLRLSHQDWIRLSDFFRNPLVRAKPAQRLPKPQAPRPAETPPPPPTVAQIKSILDRNAHALALIEAASRRPKCVFAVNLRAAGWARVEPVYRSVGRMRQVQQVLCARALLLTIEGQPDKALAVCRTMLRMSEHVAPQPLLVPQGMRFNIQGWATSTLLYQVLDVSSPSAAACRAMFEAIAHVDDRAGLVLALQGERARMLEDYRRPGSYYLQHLVPYGRWKSPGTVFRVHLYNAYLARPLFNVDETRFLRGVRKAIEEAKQPYGGGARRWFSEVAGPSAQTRSVWHLSSISLQFYDTGPAAAAKAEANLGLAQIALAAKGYKAATGAYPTSLADLRRAGWALPDDPFSGKPFIYHRKGDGFIAYSIGPNLEDNGGTSVMVRRPGKPPTRADINANIVWRVAR